MPSPSIVIKAVSWDHPDSIHLRALQRTEIKSLGGRAPGTPPSPAGVLIFLIAYRGDEPVGCGGLRPLSSMSAEAKRMFVDPSHRGLVQGQSDSIAGLLLVRLEKDAIARGWTELLLETGAFLVKAQRFYERCGFVQCELFGGYTEAQNSVCYKKEFRSCETVEQTVC